MAVVDDLDESDMVRIYTRENATQRGNAGTALAGSVAAALRLLAKAVMTGNLSRILERLTERAEQVITGQLTAKEAEGIGAPLLVRYFHEQHITGMGQYTVEQQLANLKASGAYARIMGEGEIARERHDDVAGGVVVGGRGDRTAERRLDAMRGDRGAWAPSDRLTEGGGYPGQGSTEISTPRGG